MVRLSEVFLPFLIIFTFVVGLHPTPCHLPRRSLFLLGLADSLKYDADTGEGGGDGTITKLAGEKNAAAAYVLKLRKEVSSWLVCRVGAALSFSRRRRRRRRAS